MSTQTTNTKAVIRATFVERLAQSRAAYSEWRRNNRPVSELNSWIITREQLDRELVAALGSQAVIVATGSPQPGVAGTSHHLLVVNAPLQISEDLTVQPANALCHQAGTSRFYLYTPEQIGQLPNCAACLEVGTRLADVMEQARNQPHLCHVPNCTRPVSPERLMCYPHWRKVPHTLQLKVYRTYRRGQERDKNSSPEYVEAAKAAINSLEQQGGKQ